MLADLLFRPVVPVSDPERALAFYRDVLGLHFIGNGAGGQLFESGGSQFVLVKADSAGKINNSLLTWDADDIESEVKALRTRGVVFEEYDFPGVKTVNGIAQLGSDQIAWFKDSEGNILALAQLG